MPEPDIYLSIIIPSYNEAEKIQKTLRRVQEYLSAKPFSYEIIVAADGPRDNTIEIAKNMMGEIKNLKVIERRTNRGKGYTVREGMLAAKGKIRLFMDADNGTDVAHFDKMRQLFDKGYDVVISSRDPKDSGGGDEIGQPLWRRIFGNVGNLIIQFLAVPGIWDTQNGFKAFRDRAAEKIFHLARINRFAFDVEVLLLSRKFNYKMGIVPAHWVNDPRSAVGFSTYFSFFLEVLKIKWNMMRGKYAI